MGKTICLLAILLSFLELWSHITICAAAFDASQAESNNENSLSDMVKIRPNPAYVGDQVYFTCDFFQSTKTHRDSIKELHWLKNGNSIFYYNASNSYQSPLPEYEHKIHEYDMTDNHYYMWMVVDPSDEAFYHCRFSTNEGEVIHSHKVYLKIASSEPCGTILTHWVGNLTTPLYPNTYPPHTHCVWNIIAPRHDYVKLTFVDFELDGNYPICYGDYVWIWDGTDDKGMYCKGSPNTIYSTSNTLIITFHSDKRHNFRGFLAEYEFRYRPTPYAEPTTLSPDQPLVRMNPFPNPAYVGDIVYFPCNFYFAVMEYLVKEVHWVKNGEQIYSLYKDRSHQGPLPGYEDKNSNHEMGYAYRVMYMIVDSSDEAVFQCWVVNNDSDILRSNEEFLTVHMNEPCVTNLTDHVGSFTSPLYPNPYPPRTHCVWNIIAPEKYYIKLTFVNLQLEKHYHCAHDYVHIWDGNDDLGLFCLQSPDTIYSTSNTMRVIFHSDDIVHFGGFLAEYEFLSEPTTYTEIGHTTPVQSSLRIGMHSQAYIGAQIGLHCYLFGIDKDSVKELHWLKNGERIYSHYADHSHQGPLTGYEEKIRYHHMMPYGHYILLLVDPSDEALFQCSLATNDSDILRSNEKLLTLLRSEPCGTNLSHPVGKITTPLYPNTHPPHTHCVWNIIAPEQYYIKLTFVDFELEHSNLCYFDYVHIWDGNADLGLFCESPNTIYSTGNTMRVIFHSDGSVQLRGFLAEYEFLSKRITYTEVEHITTGN